jgi:hypothetical protein
MPTTTKMGIVYPSSTDLVKDGATAMGTISTTVDAKTGLVLLSVTNFTTVASQAVTSVFSANFDNYRIVLKSSCSAVNAEIRMKMRSGATDASTNYYSAGNYTASNGSTGQTTAETNVTTGMAMIRPFTNTDDGFSSFDLMQPFLAKRTGMFGTWVDYDANLMLGGYQWGLHDVQTSYDGFNLIAESGTMTGTVSVYGYNK